MQQNWMWIMEVLREDVWPHVLYFCKGLWVVVLVGAVVGLFIGLCWLIQHFAGMEWLVGGGLGLLAGAAMYGMGRSMS